MSEVSSPEEQKKEAVGWISIAAIMLMFPVLFFVCVWIPIWFGWAFRG